jgi:hypothetical protein
MIALDVAFALLFGASSHAQAITSHSAHQLILAPRSPSSPPGRSLGHTNRPMIAYKSTAPGAPVSGLAPANSIPNPSLNHQTPSAHTSSTLLERRSLVLAGRMKVQLVEVDGLLAGGAAAGPAFEQWLEQSDCLGEGQAGRW